MPDEPTPQRDIIFVPSTPPEVDPAAARQEAYRSAPMVQPGIRTPPAATATQAEAEGTEPHRDMVLVGERTPEGYSLFGGGEKLPTTGVSGGVAESIGGILTGLNEAILSVPDLVIDSAVEGLKMAGLVPKDANIPRNMLSRIINAGDYETVNALWNGPLGQWSFGQGEFIGKTTAPGRMGMAAGEVASWGVPLTAASKYASTGYQAAKTGADVMRQQLAREAQREGIAGTGKIAQARQWLSGAGAGLRTFAAEAFPARFLGGDKFAGAGRLAATETIAGGIGGAYMQGAEEIVPGSGPWALAAPMAIYAGAKQLPGAIGSFLQGITRATPAGRAITFFSEQAPEQGGGAIATGLAYGQRQARNIRGAPITGGRGRARRSTQDKVDYELQLEENAAHTARTREVQAAIEETTGEQLALSPARVSGSRALIGEETRVASTLGQESAAEYRALQRKNSQVVADFVDKQFMGPVIDPNTGLPMINAHGEAVWAQPSLIIDAATGRLTRLQSSVSRNITDVESTLSHLSGGAGAPERTLALSSLEEGAGATGRSIRQQEQVLMDAAEKYTQAEATRLGVNTRTSVGDLGQQTVDGKIIPPVKETLLSELKTDPDFISYRRLPPIVREFLEFEFPNNQINFQDWSAFRKQVTNEMISLRGVPGARQKIRQLNTLRVSLDGIKNGPAGHFGRATDNYQEFSRIFDRVQVLPFEGGVVRRTLQTGPGTRPARTGPGGEELPAVTQYTVADEHVAAAYLQSSTTARQFMDIANSEALTAVERRNLLTDMKGVILDQARNSSGVLRDGVINPGKLDDYVRNNREMLNAIEVPNPLWNPPAKPPEVRGLMVEQATGETIRPLLNTTDQFIPASELLTNVSQRSAHLIARQAQLHAREAFINDTLLNRTLNSVMRRFGASEVKGLTDEGRTALLNTAIDQSVTGNPTLLTEIVKSVRSGPESFPGGQQALNRAILDRLFISSFSSPEALAGSAGQAAGLSVSSPLVAKDITRFSTLLGKNEGTLRTVMGDEHFEDMLVALDAFDRVFKLGPIESFGARGLDKDHLTDKLADISGVTPQGWSARMINMLERRVSPRTTSVWLAAQAWRAGESRTADKIIEQIILNPELAKAATRLGPSAFSVTPVQANQLRRLLYLAGIADPSAYERAEVMGELRPTREAPPTETLIRYPLGEQTPPQVEPTVPDTQPVPEQEGPPIASVAPSPTPPTGAVGATDYSTLFPNDPLGQAVAERRQPRDRSGIMSLLG